MVNAADKRMRSIVVLVVAYFIAGKLGLRLALVHEHATAVWPPTGIAFAALLLGGYRLWPGIFIGALLVNLTTGDGITLARALASIGIAVGNTLEAVVGVHLVNRFAGGRRVFDGAQTTLAFAIFAAMLSTPISATFGATSLSLAGLANWSNYSNIWTTWWVGDASGDLIVAPALVLWAANPRLQLSRAQALEVAPLVVTLCVLGLSSFTGIVPPRPPHMGFAFISIPALLWAAFRFGRRATAASMLLLSALGLWGWANGLGAMGISRMGVLMELQAYLGVTSVMALCVATELWQRRQHERKLESQSQSLQDQAHLLDLAPILIRDMEDRIVLWNSGAERLYGYKKEEALGKVAHLLLQTRLPEPLDQIRAKLFAEGQWDGELFHKTRDQKPVFVASLWVLQRDRARIPAAILEVSNDITERKRAEEALKAVYAELDKRVTERTQELAKTNEELRLENQERARVQSALRELSGRLLYLQDEEKRRITWELHEVAAQNMAALKLNLASVKRSSYALDTKAREALTESLALTDQCMSEIRSLSYFLHPPLLDEVGLAPALSWYANGFSERSGIRVNLEIPADMERLPQAMETALFRIVQECLNNIHRHSGSSTAKVRITRNEHSMALEIEDEGRGMPAEVLQALSNGSTLKGVGIMGMHERIQQVGGRLEIHSLERGTKVTTILPLGRGDS